MYKYFCAVIKRRTVLFSQTAALLVFIFCSAQTVNAQVDAGALQQGLEKQMPLPSPLALPQPVSPEQKRSTENTPKEVRFVVQSFELEGVSALPEIDVQNTLKSWVGRPVTFADLQEACDAVVEMYRKKGYTVQAVLPPQKISNGVVKILVTEAKLSQVIVDTPQGETRFSKENAAQYILYSNSVGQTLNVENLERALIILNETPGVMVSSQLEAGDKDGETAVRLQMTQTPLASGRVEVNNYGSRTTGANQGVAGLTLNNLSGIGDQVSINGIFSEGSQYITGAYSLPASRDGLRLGVSGTYLEYKNVSNYTSPNGGYGDSWTAGLGLKWNYQGWNLGAMVAWKVGANPLYSSTGQAVNTDGTTTQPRGWVTGSYNF